MLQFGLAEEALKQVATWYLVKNDYDPEEVVRIVSKILGKVEI